MKLSTKGRYGTRAALELALRFGDEPVIVRDISESQQIPVRYLENILNTLRRDGIVASSRGAGGGFRLSRDPSTITVGDIVRSLEGPITIVNCTEKGDCNRAGRCAATRLWGRIGEMLERELDAMTLADLADVHRNLNGSIIEYNI
jgi:Rrf2 family protein